MGQTPLKIGPDYGMGIVGKCLGPALSKGPTKDGYKIFWAYVSQSVGNVLCLLSTKQSIDLLLTYEYRVMTWQYWWSRYRNKQFSTVWMRTSHRCGTEGLRMVVQCLGPTPILIRACSKFTFPCGYLDSSWDMGTFANSSPKPKRHRDRCSRFCRLMTVTDRPTDWQTTLLGL